MEMVGMRPFWVGVGGVEEEEREVRDGGERGQRG